MLKSHRGRLIYWVTASIGLTRTEVIWTGAYLPQDEA